MIDIDYSDGIMIKTHNLNAVFTKHQLPLKIEIKNSFNNTIWDTKLESHMWASYPSNELKDVVIRDNEDNYVTRYYWDVLKNGTIFHKTLWLYCRSISNSGRLPYGIVIGTHDGEFGEWVPVIKGNLSEILLIEGSTQQFITLSKNYNNKPGIKLLNEIVTPNGGKVEFFEGGRGYTNSVIERVIKNWETEEIKSTWRVSKDINTIMNYENKIVDWLHLDLEGLDAQIIKGIKLPLPPFIIFEDYNLTPDEKEDINHYLSSLRFNLYSESGITMATK